MTVSVEAPGVKSYLIQLLMLFSINVPTVSFGLALGWVSLVSGAGAAAGAEADSDGALVVAAAATFAAGLIGVPLGERALRRGRRPALFATSAAFVVCWSLKLWCGRGWGVVAARAAAGAAGAAAWVVAPLYARETCSARLHGAGAAAPVVAHNLGVLVMLLAAEGGLTERTAVSGCLALAVLHCAACWAAPESPAFLAARGDRQGAASALARLRGTSPEHPALRDELRDLPADRVEVPFYRSARDLLSDRRRRRAFLVALVCVVGQEACGVLTLLQFGERVFVLAGEEAGAPAARRAVLLGAAQLAASLLALYLVERVGRRPLFVWGALGTSAALALGAGAVRGAWGGGAVAAGALAAAVAADSLALQPAPYAVLSDMFDYQYRGTAVLLATGAASAGSAAETLLFPCMARAAGLPAALALAAGATLALAAFALVLLPETRGREPERIYDAMGRARASDPEAPPRGADRRKDPVETGDSLGGNVGHGEVDGCDNAGFVVSRDEGAPGREDRIVKNADGRAAPVSIASEDVTCGDVTTDANNDVARVSAAPMQTPTDDRCSEETQSTDL